MSRANKKRSNAELAKAWIFPWRRTFRRRWTLLLGALIVLPIMALMLTTVRVRVFPMPPSLNRTGDLVMVADTEENREWLEKIAQKTPFPALHDDQEVEKMADAALHQTVRPAYQPQTELRDVNLPRQTAVFDTALVLPIVEATQPEATTAVEPRMLQPRLRLLGNFSSADLPEQWPAFLGAVDTMSGQKFLLEVTEKGGVASCVSFPRESTKRNVALENWLKQLRFPVTRKTKGWIGCEILWEHHD